MVNKQINSREKTQNILQMFMLFCG